MAACDVLELPITWIDLRFWTEQIQNRTDKCKTGQNKYETPD